MHVPYVKRTNDVTAPSEADSVSMATAADDVILHLWWHTHGPWHTFRKRCTLTQHNRNTFAFFFSPSSLPSPPLTSQLGKLIKYTNTIMTYSNAPVVVNSKILWTRCSKSVCLPIIGPSHSQKRNFLFQFFVLSLSVGTSLYICG